MTAVDAGNSVATSGFSGTQPEYVDLYGALPDAMKAMQSLEAAIAAGPLDQKIFELVKMRASQINGCAYCLDMHYKDARSEGETEERLYMLNAWRESRLYSDRERAALALTEQVTLISQGHVSPEVEAEARRQFSDVEYASLVFAIVAINSWNRLAITSHSPAGRYQPGKHNRSN
ncbi:MAG TPA: carboxymuconolactone decarboxylase family protein [Microthrixaceae bacterium]|nr:carboxymuconolactone decarboxylase family protein [Microthrixaceae bacterium]